MPVGQGLLHHVVGEWRFLKGPALRRQGRGQQDQGEARARATCLCGMLLRPLPQMSPHPLDAGTEPGALTQERSSPEDWTLSQD